MAYSDLRISVLSSHTDLLLLQREWSLYQYRSSDPFAVFDYDYVCSLRDRVYVYLTDPELFPLWQEAEKINHAFYERRRRLKDRIVSMYIRAPCFFGTLTFTNDVLSSTSFDTRRKYVKRFLKSHCVDYIANCDFGDLNGREHYHCVIIPKSGVNLNWSFGFYDFRLIRNSDTDFKRVSSYISKLTNHALKHSTKQLKIIYSRG